TTTDDQAECAVRAANAYLNAHDSARAKELVELVAPFAQRDAILDLRVRIARSDGDRRALAEALDLLATSSHEPAERRAEMLVDAARASAGRCDDPRRPRAAPRGAEPAPPPAARGVRSPPRAERR